jgi:hypothetical protein
MPVTAVTVMAIGNPLNDGWVSYPDEHTAFRMPLQKRFANAIGRLRKLRPGILPRDSPDSQVRSGMAAMNAK